MSSATQYVELPGSKGGAGGVAIEGGVRWEQGTCNASFRDEAQKLNSQHKQNQNGNKKVSFVLHLLSLFPRNSQFPKCLCNFSFYLNKIATTACNNMLTREQNVALH